MHSNFYPLSGKLAENAARLGQKKEDIRSLQAKKQARPVRKSRVFIPCFHQVLSALFAPFDYNRIFAQKHNIHQSTQALRKPYNQGKKSIIRKNINTTVHSHTNSARPHRIW